MPLLALTDRTVVLMRMKLSRLVSIPSAAVHSAAKANESSELTQSEDCCRGYLFLGIRTPFPETQNLEKHLKTLAILQLQFLLRCLL